MGAVACHCCLCILDDRRVISKTKTRRVCMSLFGRRLAASEIQQGMTSEGTSVDHAQHPQLEQLKRTKKEILRWKTTKTWRIEVDGEPSGSISGATSPSTEPKTR